ncbi:MAG: thioredoxin family protein [Myxococcota bacterium]
MRLWSRCANCGEEDALDVRALGELQHCASCGVERSPLGTPFALTSPRQLAALDAGTLPVVVCYGAGWCVETHRTEASLEALAEAAKGRMVVVSVDVDAHPQLAERARVRSLPTLAVRIEGRETIRHRGAMQPEALRRWAGHWTEAGQNSAGV